MTPRLNQIQGQPYKELQMSWSMATFKSCWMHAHDAQQEAFMKVAVHFFNKRQDYQQHHWLKQWAHHWQRESDSYINGLSNLKLDQHLHSNTEIEVFLKFLVDYRSWLEQQSNPITIEQEAWRVPALIEFANDLCSLINQDGSNPKIKPTA